MTRTIRTGLVLLLSLVLTLSFGPAKAFAEEAAMQAGANPQAAQIRSITIGDDILVSNFTQAASGSYWKWEPSLGTLVLFPGTFRRISIQDAPSSIMIEIEESVFFSHSYLSAMYSTSSVTLSGKFSSSALTVSAPAADEGAVHMEKNLSIKSGSNTVFNTHDAGLAIYVDGSLLIQGGTLNGRAKHTALSVGGNISIEGGTLDLSAPIAIASADKTKSTITVRGGVLSGTGSIDGDISASGGSVSMPNSSLSGNLTVNGESALVQVASVGGETTVTRGIAVVGGNATVGGDATLSQDLTLAANGVHTMQSGATLKIPDGRTLTNGGSITGSGMSIDADGTLINSGMITGDIVNNGTIINNGSITGSITGIGTVINKSIAIGAQSDTLIAGTGGSVYFPLTTESIASAIYTPVLNGAPAGVTVSGDVQIADNAGMLKIATADETPAGIHPMTVAIDGAVSASFDLIVTGTGSGDATLSAGSLAGEALAGIFAGGASIESSSALAVTIPDTRKTGAALLLIQGDANSVVKYVQGAQPTSDAGYTNTWGSSTTVTVADGDVIWLMVMAQNSAAKRYYKITVTVPPAPRTHTLTVSAGTGGFLSGSQSGTYTVGDSISITATANANYTFTGWTASGVTLSSNTMNPAAFVMPDNDVALTANFRYSSNNIDPPVTTPTFAVRLSAQPAEGGSIAGGGTFESGAPCTVIATANTGYKFLCWMEGSAQISTSASYTFPVTAARSLMAVFEKTSGGSEGEGGTTGPDGQQNNEAPEHNPVSQLTPTNVNPVNGVGTVTLQEATTKTLIEQMKEIFGSTEGKVLDIRIFMPAGMEDLNFRLTPATLSTLKEAGISGLTLRIGSNTLLVDMKLLEHFYKNAENTIRLRIYDAEISTKGGANGLYTVTASYMRGKETVYLKDMGGGSLTLRLPYAPTEGESAARLYLRHYPEGNAPVALSDSFYDTAKRTLVGKATRWGLYGPALRGGVKYTDIDGHWAEYYIEYLAARSILGNPDDTRFQPDTDITKAEFAAALKKLMRSEHYAQSKSASGPITRLEAAQLLIDAGVDMIPARKPFAFKDVGGKTVYKVQQAGYMNPYSDGKFHGSDTLTKAQASAILSRVAHISRDGASATGWAIADNGKGRLYYSYNGVLTLGKVKIDGTLYDFGTSGIAP